jgi:hypothetical protein
MGLQRWILEAFDYATKILKAFYFKTHSCPQEDIEKHSPFGLILSVVTVTEFC